MIKMKPKDISEILKIPPYLVTKYAKEIELSGRYRFEKTPLGSYIFKKEEIELISEYKDMKMFFNKKNAIKMLKMDNDIIKKKDEKYPEWIHFLSKKTQEKIKKS